jgi:uncharacterized damage-inducible protein DinB
MDRSELRDLLTHMEWADGQTWRVLRGVAAAQSDERLRWLCHHSHLVQSIYLQAWRGDSFQLTELASYPDLEAIEAWARPYYARLTAFADSVDDARFGMPVDFPWSAMIAEKFGKVLPATLSESVWQVLSHSTYHRGQIATRIREIGGEPPVVDFLYWVWAGKPAPDWSREDRH